MIIINEQQVDNLQSNRFHQRGKTADELAKPCAESGTKGFRKFASRNIVFFNRISISAYKRVMNVCIYIYVVIF